MNLANVVERIDEAHGTNWHVYRSAMGHWCVSLGVGSVIDGQTIDEALEKAAAYRNIPLLPRKPEGMHAERFEARKAGSKWQLFYDRQFYCGNITTRKEARRYIELACQRSRDEVAEWERLYGEVARGVEGVDFRYPN